MPSAEIICPACSGEGYIEWGGGPGVWDPRQGQFYPSEGADPCERCGASGLIDAQDDDGAAEVDGG